jgi:hypothetical protein
LQYGMPGQGRGSPSGAPQLRQTSDSAIERERRTPAPIRARISSVWRDPAFMRRTPD